MCLYINQNYHKKQKGEKFPAPFIADENILVSKKLEKKWVGKHYWYYTPYQEKLITFNENGYCLVESDLIDTFCPFGIECVVNTYYDTTYYKVYEGIHSYNNKIEDEEFWKIYHYAIIPKGGLYYIGIWGDIVSDKLIIFKNQKAFEDYKKENKITANVWHYNCNNEK